MTGLFLTGLRPCRIGLMDKNPLRKAEIRILCNSKLVLYLKLLFIYLVSELENILECLPQLKTDDLTKSLMFVFIII